MQDQQRYLAGFLFVMVLTCFAPLLQAAGTLGAGGEGFALRPTENAPRPLCHIWPTETMAHIELGLGY